MSNFISPNDLMSGARNVLLNGRAPDTTAEWEAVVSYWSASIAPGLESSACRLLARLFDCPLSDDAIDSLVVEQRGRAIEMPRFFAQLRALVDTTLEAVQREREETDY